MRNIRWGILGYARIAREFVIAAISRAEGCELVVVASRDENRLTDCAGRFPGLRVDRDYNAVLADPDVDAVYIPLPNSLHCEWTIKAAEAGKHVLCEKPLALNAEECGEMIAACRENGVLLMEACMYRYTARTQQVVEILKSGVLGELRSATSCCRFFLGDRESVRWRRPLGGGSLYDVGCYALNFIGLVADIAAGVTPGKSEPDLVTGAAITSGSVDVRVSAVLRYPFGLLATAHCGFDAHRQMFSEVVGTKGILKIENTFGEEPGSIILSQGGDSEHIRVVGSDRYKMEIEDFSDAIREARLPMLSLLETERNVRVLDRLRATVAACAKECSQRSANLKVEHVG